MPAKRKKEKIAGHYFTWLLGSRNGVFFADGRSNHPHQVGRHSLGTCDRQEAMEQLKRLDLVKAVEFGLADRSQLNAESEEAISLEKGRDLYLKHVERPPVLGGTGKSTAKRYRPVFAKFIPFALEEGVRTWQSVSKRLLEAYGAWLDDQDYAPASEYLELTTLKQAMKWLAEDKLIPSTCLFAMHLEKPKGTTTYCYQREEVDAMVEHCFAQPALNWLGEVIIALATTGLRISELASLRWDDFDFAANAIRLTDTRHRAVKTERDKASATKSHRDRSLPMRPELRTVLETKTRHKDGRVFHGPLGGVLKPDTIRNILIREVLEPLAERFPPAPGRKSFRDGRLHSFRHYFCSMSATNNVPEQILMSWLGHQDSKMVRHYYHLHDAPSQAHMARTEFITPLSN
jgi:integrase